MSSNINLIQGENKTNVTRKSRVIVLRWISIVFLFFVAFFSILLFILSNRISINDVKNDQGIVLQKISLLKDKAAKFNLLNDRLKGITSLLGSRKKYTNTLNAILEQVPEGVSVRSLTLDKDNLSLTANSTSLLPLDSFLTNVTKISLEKHVIRDMTIEGLSIDKINGVYSLSLKAKSL